jgi:tricorn protease
MKNCGRSNGKLLISAPSSGVGSPDGHWLAENIGVIPEIEVEHNPQLDKAIEIVLEELPRNPLAKPKRPAYPDYHKKQATNGETSRISGS